MKSPIRLLLILLLATAFAQAQSPQPNSYVAALVSPSGTGTDFALAAGTGTAVNVLPNTYSAILICTANCTSPTPTFAFATTFGGGGSGGATTPATTSLLKGNGSANGVSAATPGTDYATPAQITSTAIANTVGITAKRIGMVYYAEFFPGATMFAKMTACMNAVIAGAPAGAEVAGTCDARNLNPSGAAQTETETTTLSIPPSRLANNGHVQLIAPSNTTFNISFQDPTGSETHRGLHMLEGGQITADTAPGLWTTIFQPLPGTATNMVALCDADNNADTNNYWEVSGIACQNTDSPSVTHRYSSGHFADFRGMVDHAKLVGNLFQNGNSAQNAIIGGCCNALVAHNTFSGALTTDYTHGGDAVEIDGPTSGLVGISNVTSSEANGHFAINVDANASFTWIGGYIEANGGGTDGNYPQAPIYIQSNSHGDFEGGFARGLCDTLKSGLCDGNFYLVENHSAYTIFRGWSTSGGFVSAYRDQGLSDLGVSGTSRVNYNVEPGNLGTCSSSAPTSAACENFGVVPDLIRGVATHYDGSVQSPYTSTPTGPCSYSGGWALTANGQQSSCVNGTWATYGTAGSTCTFTSNGLNNCAIGQTTPAALSATTITSATYAAIGATTDFSVGPGGHAVNISSNYAELYFNVLGGGTDSKLTRMICRVDQNGGCQFQILNDANSNEQTLWGYTRSGLSVPHWDFVIPVGAPALRTNTASNADLAGQLTLSAGTASYTFISPYTSAPICTATDTTATAPVRVQTTTTTLTVSGTTTDVINYICVGRN